MYSHTRARKKKNRHEKISMAVEVIWSRNWFPLVIIEQIFFFLPEVIEDAVYM